jgi:hypothetical protein
MKQIMDKQFSSPLDAMTKGQPKKQKGHATAVIAKADSN